MLDSIGDVVIVLVVELYQGFDDGVVVYVVAGVHCYAALGFVEECGGFVARWPIVKDFYERLGSAFHVSRGEVVGFTISLIMSYSIWLVCVFSPLMCCMIRLTVSKGIFVRAL